MKNVKLLIALFFATMAISCNCNKQDKREFSYITGQWDIDIYGIPEYGDQRIATTIEEQDSLLTGFFTDASGETINFDTIEVEEDEITFKFNWRERDVHFVLESDSLEADKMQGKFMMFLKVEAVRKNS